MKNVDEKQLQLNGKTVWLVQTPDEDSKEDSCSSCVYDWNVPAYESNACPHNAEHGRLECTLNEDVLMHFTDGTQKATTPVVSSSVTSSALNTQVGGEHYKQMKIQPVEYIHANNLSFLEGNVVKYITRHKTKNKAQDIRKIIHYCTLILQLEYNETYEQDAA